MNNMNLELSMWGDGTIRLSFWDNLRGKDVHFVLDEDGQARRRYYQSEESDDEMFEPVDLVLKLRELVQENKS